MSFDDALKRVLDPDGLYWRYPADENDDPSVVRTVEVRLDVPVASVPTACRHMEEAGWAFSSIPDDPAEDEQRVYFRNNQSLLDPDKQKMLTTALKAAHESGGRFRSWIDRPEERQN